jgi:septal ring factor EnvC (AmiA/AmiB activator)
LTLAKQAYTQASKELDEANNALAKAQAARQAALKVLQDATTENQKTTSALGSAEWDLNQAIAALNVANAAKDAADRTSALVIANGSPQAGTQVETKSKFD